MRLLLALLLASFAVPAAAAVPICHDGAITMAHHDAPASDKATPAHVCVGCVPLADWTGSRLAERVEWRALPVAAKSVRLDLRRAVAPAIPPPRRA